MRSRHAWGLVWTVGCCVLLCPVSVLGAPIGVRTAAPVHVGGGVLRLEVGWRYAARGPAPSFPVAHEATSFLTGMWGVGRRWALGAELGGAARWLSVRGPGGERLARRVLGAGDPAIFVRWMLLQHDARSGFVRLAAIAGTGIPLGAQRQADALGRLPPWQQPSEGVWSPWLEAVLTVQRTAWQLDLSGRATWRPGGVDWDPGEEARLDASWQYVLWRVPEMTEGVPGFLYGVLEGRMGWRGAHQGRLAPFRSGGTFASLLAGVQLAWEGHAVEVAARLPLRRPFGKHDTVAALAAWRFDL